MINFIYCGRISKEKGLIEIYECINKLSNNVRFAINIIGDGSYLNEFKEHITKNYNHLMKKTIFYGAMSQAKICDLYNILNNRIFIFTSVSETFGKTPMEAGMCGIPILIKRCPVVEKLYIDNENAMIFCDKNDFSDVFNRFMEKTQDEKKNIIATSMINIKKYDQKVIFNNLLKFLINSDSKLRILLGFCDIFTFHSMSKLVRCSGMLIGDD